MGAGEENKNLNTAHQLWQTLIENKADRRTLIINLGGGVVTDLGGFVASLYKRGIPFIHVPTTLLGMIDAAIGGKTAIDIGVSKNMVGTFTRPQGVFISVDFLHTLSRRDLFAGFGELIKYALIASKPLWEVIENQDLGPDMDMEWMITECATIKAQIVESDFEEKGERKILNFGHTAGHALESFALNKGLRKLHHGEAVALGMIIELYLSNKILGFDEVLLQQIQNFILDNFDLYPIESSDFNSLLDFMKIDKKITGSQISFVLLSEIGKPHFGQTVEDALIINALEYYANL